MLTLRLTARMLGRPLLGYQFSPRLADIGGTRFWRVDGKADYGALGRWCTWRLEVEIAPNPRLLCDDRLATDGIWASRCQHPVQHRHADGSLGLLGGEAAGPQPGSDQRLVATHCRFN